jgi:hypothetical protein
MGLFGFGNKERSTMILIDIGSASVGGAYAHFGTGKPIIYYATRIVIEQREEETVEACMIRTLHDLTDLLVREGAPAVRREVGSAHADGILVSVGAPWQEMRVRTESIQSIRPFQFTKKLLTDLVAKNAHVPEDRIDSGESVIATILNGYEIPNPFGKQVKRAELVILSSTLLKSITHDIETALRKAFHTHQITFTGFAPASYQVFRDLYPHEHDYLLLDIRGVRSDLAYVQRGLLLDVGSVPLGTHKLLAIGRSAVDDTIMPEALAAVDRGLGASYLNAERNARFSARVEEAEEEWVGCLSTLLRDFATRHALPRTLFLLADDDVRGFLMRAIDTPSIHALWLSDEPLRIVPVTHAQFTSYITINGDSVGDIFIDLLALFHAKQIRPLTPDPEPTPAKISKKDLKKQAKDAKAAAAAAPKEPGIPLSAMVSSAPVEEGEADFSM